jgi:ElaA protein
MALPLVTFECRHFADIGGREMYAMLALRSRVFVVEQQCVYLDPDGLDVEAHHLLGWSDGDAGVRSLLCATRILPPGAAYAEPSIGRVVTAPAVRGGGMGRRLMGVALEQCAHLYPGQSVRIGAQRYLESFYASLGFETVSPPYVEDGIPHVTMLLSL